jgi:riboflavin transporter FmnP
MKQLWSQIVENISFIVCCIAIIAGLSLLARLAEHFMPEKRKVSIARRCSIIGICAAIATILHMLDFSIPFIAPEFYKLDFSELPVLLCGFFLGPSATVACEGIKILLKLLLKGTSTAFVGDFANFFVGCSLVLPATIFYHLRKSKNSAVLGLIIGSICITVFGSAFNAIYLLPKFAQLYGIPLDAIIGMGSKINPLIQNVTSFVFFCVAPLNLLKAVAVSVLTMLLYKRVARPLFGKSL